MLRRLTSFFRKNHAEQDLDDELQASLEQLAEEYLRKGASPQEALRLARIELGGVEQVKEEVRDIRGLPALDSLIRDLRHGLRNLLRSPGFSIAVVVSLGLALGANAAILGLLDKLILRPLPVQDPSRLVVVEAPPLPELRSAHVVVRSIGGGGRVGLSYPLFDALRSRAKVFSGMLAQSQVTATLEAGGEPVAAKGAVVTGNYFELLGVSAAIGRLLSPADDERGACRPVVALSHGFWQRQFASDAGILNRVIRLNREPMTVAGVTAPGFTGTVAGTAADFFAPLCMGAAFGELPREFRFQFDSPDFHIYKVMARLAPGVDLQHAEQTADLVYRQLLAETTAQSGASPVKRDRVRRSSSPRYVRLTPGGYASSDQSALSRDLQTPLLLLGGMVGLLLVIAAGNVANLFLARGEARSHEFAIRFALGAGRGRVLRALLMESLILTLTAGTLGLLLARWTSDLAPVMLNIERLPDGVTPAPDFRIGVTAMLLSLAVGAGIWAASAPRVVGWAALAGLCARAMAGARPTLNWRRTLVVAQAALSVVLLCGSALLSRSLIRLMSVGPGFPTADLYSFSLDPGSAGYDRPRSGALLAQVLDSLRSLTGVGQASIATNLPLSNDGVGTFVFADQTSGVREEQKVETDIVDVGPGYFENLRIELVAGREFSTADAPGAKIVVMNESLAQRLFGRNDPLGRGIGFDVGRPDWRVVGIVKDVKSGPRAPARLLTYRPYNFQSPGRTRADFVLRAEKGVRLTTEMVGAAVRRLAPAVAVQEFTSMSEQAAHALYRDRMLAWVSLCFAGLAALLCAIGIFGLTSFSVTQRMQEIGVRVALGATRGSIQWLVMKEVSFLAATGCAVGLVVFLFAGRVLSTTLFELSPSDPASLALGAAILGGAALLAGFLPAHRATRVDPASTLRQE